MLKILKIALEKSINYNAGNVDVMPENGSKIHTNSNAFILLHLSISNFVCSLSCFLTVHALFLSKYYVFTDTVDHYSLKSNS